MFGLALCICNGIKGLLAKQSFIAKMITHILICFVPHKNVLFSLLVVVWGGIDKLKAVKLTTC